MLRGRRMSEGRTIILTLILTLTLRPITLNPDTNPNP